MTSLHGTSPAALRRELRARRRAIPAIDRDLAAEKLAVFADRARLLLPAVGEEGLSERQAAAFLRDAKDAEYAAQVNLRPERRPAFLMELPNVGLVQESGARTIQPAIQAGRRSASKTEMKECCGSTRRPRPRSASSHAAARSAPSAARSVRHSGWVTMIASTPSVRAGKPAMTMRL